MKLPETIKIGDVEYKIQKKSFIFDSNIAGRINYHKKTVELKKDASERTDEDSFFHEIAHGILKELEFNHPKIASFRNNEEVVQEMGLLLRTIFIDLVEKQK